MAESKAEHYLLREYAIKCWLEDVLCVDDLSAFAEEEDESGSDLRALLQNGVILCNLMLNLRLKSIPRVNLGKDLELGFKKKENINFFLQACEENGMLSSKLFRVHDLTDLDKGQFMRVVECLEKLAEIADKEWEFYFKLKSVKDVSDRRAAGKLKLTFSDKDIERASTIVARWERLTTARSALVSNYGGISPLNLAALNSENNDSSHTNNRSEPTNPTDTPLTEQAPSPRGEEEGPHYPQRKPLFSPSTPAEPTSVKATAAPRKISIPTAITNPKEWIHGNNAPAALADVSGLKNKFQQVAKTSQEAPTASPLPQPAPVPNNTTAPASSAAPPPSPRSVTPPPVSPRNRVPPPVSPRTWMPPQSPRAGVPPPSPRSMNPPPASPRVPPTPPSALHKPQYMTETVERGVIRLQALYRGWRVRREYIARVRNLAYRQNVAREIYKTEEDYVNSLKILFSAYLDPIKEKMEDSKWKSGPKSADEVELKTFKGLYSDLQVIFNYNKKLLNDIEPIVQNWGPFQKLGHIFLQLSNFLKVYTQYVKDYEQARTEFANARKSSLAFRRFMQDCEEKNKDILESQDMSAFLIRPVQRIPRYLLLLKDLKKHTDEDHADYEPLHKALSAIENVAVYIEQKAEEADNVQMVTAIQARFANKAESLVSAGRKFVRQGELEVLLPKGKNRCLRTMFLFNDILVETKKIKGKTGESKMASLMGRKRSNTVAVTSNGGKDLRFKKIYHLKHLRPIDMPDDEKNINWFVLEHTGFGEIALRLYATDRLNKTEWIIDLRSVREKLEKDSKEREGYMNSLKGMKGLERLAKSGEGHVETVPIVYGPQTGDSPSKTPPVLPPKPRGPSMTPREKSASFSGPCGKTLEKSHSYQTVLNSTKEPEAKNLTKKIQAETRPNRSNSAASLLIEENAEKSAVPVKKEKAPRKRLAKLHSFGKI